jgi:hypothetical protein
MLVDQPFNSRMIGLPRPLLALAGAPEWGGRVPLWAVPSLKLLSEKMLSLGLI